ncbi:growth hormone secretagogue receptor type 1-like [Mya arenaria]|uniref:growth hormone secretagogue receptor type 1-like n=1 Tax=Mya arenaria TaxID=6604 RepID=UPI0022E02DF6|nr:growth hormone secretagogue receptor type 1-like [Mya arenaria]
MDVNGSLQDVNVTSSIFQYGTRRNVASWQTVTAAVCLSPIIVLGVIGNLFSLLVWIKGRRRKTSTARYLSALALADILVLLLPAAEFWVFYVLHVDLRAKSWFLCKFYSYLTYLTPVTSAWILVAVTVERAMSVWIPHRINVVCQPKTALLFVFVAVIILSLVYAPICTGSGIETAIYMHSNGGGFSVQECTIHSSSLIKNSFVVWLVLDLCLFFIIPFGIMLFCNISIMAKVVCLANARRNTLQARGGQTTAPRGGRSQKMLKTVTRRIIVLSVTYCVCNAPLAIYNLILISDGADDILNSEHIAGYRIVFHILMFLNNGVNFLLYCMIGSGFRKDFVGMFKSGSRTSTTR